MGRALADVLRLVVSASWLGRAFGLLLGGAALGLALLVAADSLVSMPRIGERLRQAQALHQLGDARGMDHVLGMAISQFSECIGLSVASSPVASEPAFSIRSRAVLWQPGQNVCTSAIRASSDPAGVTWFDYSRYWHGYRVLVYPLVEATGLRPAGLLLGAIAITCASAFFVVMLPLAGLGALLAFAAVMILSGLPFVYLTPTHAVSLAMLFAGAALFAAMRARLAQGTSLLVAFGLGAAYAYVDFFYNPGAFAMLLGGTIVIEATQARRPLAPAAIEAGVASLCCLAGYGLFWATKWVLVLPFFALAGADFPVLIGDFGRWAVGGVDAYRPLAASAKLAVLTVDDPVRGAIFAAVVVGALAMAAVQWRRAGPVLGALAVPIACGFAAIEAAAAHSLAHATFTFRIVPLAVALVLMALGALTQREGQSAARRCRSPVPRPRLRQGQGGFLGLARRPEPLAVKPIEAMGRCMEAEAASVAGDDARGLAAHLDHIGIGLLPGGFGRLRNGIRGEHRARLGRRRRVAEGQSLPSGSVRFGQRGRFGHRGAVAG